MQNFGLADLGWAIGFLLSASIIGILWTRRSAVVSIVSGNWRSSMQNARAQKRQREWESGRNTMSSAKMVPLVPPRPTAVPGIGTPHVDLVALARILTKDQYVDLGALMIDEKGKPICSGKILYRIAGGNYGEFLARMRRLRAGEVEEPEEELPAHVTPIVGRATSAQFYDPDYPYQAPA